MRRGPKPKQVPALHPAAVSNPASELQPGASGEQSDTADVIKNLGAEGGEPEAKADIAGHGINFGFNHREVPKYIHFGHVVLLLKKLYY